MQAFSFRYADPGPWIIISPLNGFNMDWSNSHAFIKVIVHAFNQIHPAGLKYTITLYFLEALLFKHLFINWRFSQAGGYVSVTLDLIQVTCDTPYLKIARQLQTCGTTITVTLLNSHTRQLPRVSSNSQFPFKLPYDVVTCESYRIWGSLKLSNVTSMNNIQFSVSGILCRCTFPGHQGCIFLLCYWYTH